MKRVTVTDARARLTSLLQEVESTGERYLIERRGQPAAALVSLKDLRSLGQPIPAKDEEPKGALALVGLFADPVSDEEIDEMIRYIYADRERSRLSQLQFLRQQNDI